MDVVLRYLTLSKLEWLMSDKGIYVGAAKDQSDFTEGEYDYETYSKEIKESNPDVDKPEVERLLSGMMEVDRTTTFLSSWYLGDDEKIEMWNEYAKDGVIIVSHTWKLLSLLPKPLDQAVNFCSCIYNNKKKEKSLGNSFAYKSEKFAHENEYRLVFDLGNIHS